MKQTLSYLDEPPLQFGRDKHPDIRYGIMNYGPSDLEDKRRPCSIKVGIVGTSEGIASSSRWIERCRKEIAPWESPKRNLFAPFPGFSGESPFQADCILDSSLNAEVKGDDIKKFDGLEKFNDKVRESVGLFLERLRHAAQKKPDVL